MGSPWEAGFTGRVWEAVPADQLVREVTTGPGARPMAEAAGAFERLAAGLSEATAEYRAILLVLGRGWRSDTGDAVVARVTALQHWLDDTAAATADTANRAAAQAAAYQTAVVAMPGATDLAVLQQLSDTLTHGISLGGPVTGISAELEDRADTVTSLAAEAMRQYEIATTPLAEPWPQQHPPVLTTETALVAERRSAAPTVAQREPMPVTEAAHAAGPVAVAVQPSAPAAYRAEPAPVRALEGESAEPVVSVTAAIQPATAPAVPGMLGGATDSAAIEHESVQFPVRAADAGGVPVGLSTAIAAAPAVLGDIAVPPSHSSTGMEGT